MNFKKIAITFFLLLINTVLSQSKEPEITVNLLENDNIAEINLNQEKFIKSIGKIMDYCKENFDDLPKSQKIGLHIVVHKNGKPTYECYSNPQIKEDLKSKILNDLKSIDIENTKLVDFPIFISINSSNTGEITDFEGFLTPINKRIKEYKEADLKTKLELNKRFAIDYVLPVLIAFETSVDDKFEGVKSFGKLLEKTNFNEPQDFENLFYRNKNYWRATMEIEKGNQLIPITHIFALASQGELGYATENIEIIRMFTDPKTIPYRNLNELYFRINEFNKELEKEINKGIIKHDEGKYDEAIKVYDELLKIYPNSSWTLYEKYYSQNAKKLKDKTNDVNDRNDWDIAKEAIYKHNPLYNMDVRASNGKEAYLLFRRYELQKLFTEKDNTLKDIFEYASIATDLGVYDFAAQLYWISTTFDNDNEKESLHRFLYCLEKLGENDLKNNFKGDFDKIFKKIEQERDEEMKKSEIYKSMDNK